MNRTYRTQWNSHRHCYVTTSELGNKHHQNSKITSLTDISKKVIAGLALAAVSSFSCGADSESTSEQDQLIESEIASVVPVGTLNTLLTDAENVGRIANTVLYVPKPNVELLVGYDREEIDRWIDANPVTNGQYITDSIGVRAIEGLAKKTDKGAEVADLTTTITLGKKLILLGYRRSATNGDVVVKEGQLQLGTNNTEVSDQGGYVRGVTVENGSLTVTGKDTEFSVGTLALGTGNETATLKIDESSSLTISDYTDESRAKISNSGLLVIKSGGWSLNSEINNSGVMAISLEGPEITNKFTNEKDGLVVFVNGFSQLNEDFVNYGRIESYHDADFQTDVVIPAGSTLYVNKASTSSISDLQTIVEGKLTNYGDIYSKSLVIWWDGAVEVEKGALLKVKQISARSSDRQLTLKDGSTLVVEEYGYDDWGDVLPTIKREGTASLVLGSLAAKYYDEQNAERVNALMTEQGAEHVDSSGYAKSESTADSTTATTVSRESVLDFEKSDDYGVTVSGGQIGGHDIYSGVTGNETWTFDSDVEIVEGGSVLALDSGYLQAGTSLTVDPNAEFNVQNITVDGSEYTNNFGVQGTLVNKGTVTVSGTLSELGVGSSGSLISSGDKAVTNINTLTVNGGAVRVEDGAKLNVTSLGTVEDQQTGSLSVSGADSEATFAKVDLHNLNVTVSDAGFIGLGITKEQAVQINGIDTSKAVLAIDATTSSLDVSTTSILVGTPSSDTTLKAGEVYFAADSVLVVDADSTGDIAVFTGDSSGSGSIRVEKGSQLVIADPSWGLHSVELSEDLAIEKEEGAWTGSDVIDGSGNGYSVNVSVVDGKLVFAVGLDTSIQGMSSAYTLPGVINGLINDVATAKQRRVSSDSADIAFIDRLLSSVYFGDGNGKLDVDWSSNVWNSVSNIGAISGIHAYSIDMSRQIADAVAAHAGSDTDKELDRNLWVQIVANSSQASSMKSGLPSTIGYSASSYGLILGADFLNSYDGSIGLAFNYVSGDLDSKGNYLKTKSDATVWGLSFYGSKQIGQVKISGLLSYQTTSGKAKQGFSDLLGNGYAVESNLNSNSLVLGIRGEYIIDLDNAVIKPYAGLRYSYTGFDDADIKINGEKAFKVSTDNSGIVSVPIGVAFEGKIKANNVTVKPTLDLSLIPQLTGKSVKATVSARNYSGTDKMSYNVNGTYLGALALGIEAKSKAHSFSVFYRGAVGDQGRSSHSVNVGYRFSF